jgi:5-methylcytosine-specific restriction endonuclease McrA
MQYPPKRICQNPACGRKFRMKHRTKDGWKNKGKYCCPECYRDHRWGAGRPRLRRSKLARSSASRDALARSLRKRCKVYGVTFDPACTRQAVLERDGWVCQKCRAVCHKEYVLHAGTLTPDPRNAEHDHIWPLSVKGSPGNVFENSQCLCRKCNLAKGDTVEGQLRLCLEEEAWGKGVRVRSPHNSRSCVATQAVGHSISRSRSRHPMAL